MGRAPCCEKVGLKRGRWTTEEDNILSNYIQSHGEGSWRALPKNAGLLRCGKSCRLRWVNYLKTDLKRGKFSSAEDDVIIRMHASLGNRWSTIAGSMPGRTDNEIKNYWNSHLSRQIYSYRKRPNIVSNPIHLPPPAVVNLPNPTSGNNNVHTRQGGRASRDAMKKNKLIGLQVQPHKQRHNHPPPNADGIDELQNEVPSSLPMQPTTTTNLGEEANALIINDDDASSCLVHNLLDDSYCDYIDHDVLIDGVLLQGVDINGAHILHDTPLPEETQGGPHVDLNKSEVRTESDAERSGYDQRQQTTTSVDESNSGDEGKILLQDFEMMGWDLFNDTWDLDGSIEGLDICNTERDLLFSWLLDDNLDDTHWTTSDQLF